METCADLVSKCLFLFDAAWGDGFKPQLGHARLPFTDSAGGNALNRTYYTVLFRRLQLLGRTGCAVTALALARHLLSLDPAGDPAVRISRRGVACC